MTRAADPPADPELEPDLPALALGPSTRMLWRAPEVVQLEVGTRGVLVEGLSPALIRTIGGSAPSAAPSLPAPAGTVRALRRLVSEGYLWRRPESDDGFDDQRRPPVPRLAGELNSLAARHGPDAAAMLAARGHAKVTVTGATRLAPQIAALLAAAGVGHVHCTGGGSVRLRHCAPGGVDPQDEGRPLSAAADDAVRRGAPETDTAPLPAEEPADLVVLAPDTPVEDARRASLHAGNVAHLLVTTGVDHGSVGPLVVPGLTSCLRCADLHRSDRDPAWSALAAQLSVGRRHGETSDLAVATVLAGTAALQVLQFLDGGEPASLEGSLELHLPDWRLRRRTRAVHPDCGCTQVVR